MENDREPLGLKTRTRVRVLPIVIITLFVIGSVISLSALIIVRKGTKDFKLLVESFHNMQSIKTVSARMDLTVKPEKREKNTVAIFLLGTKDSLDIENAIDEMFNEIPTDFFMNFYLISDSDTGGSKSFKDANTYVKLGGKVKLGGTAFSGEGEIIKVKENFYYKIKEFPIIDSRIDFSAIKDAWVSLPPDEMAEQSEYFSKMFDTSDQKIADYYAVFEAALDTKFIIIKSSLPKEKLKGILVNHFLITFDYSKYPAFLKKLAVKFGDKFTASPDFEILKSFEDPKNKKMVETFSKMQLFEVYIDPKAKQIRKLVFTLKLAPPISNKKFQGKQLKASFTLVLNKINEKISIAKPKSFISMDEALSRIARKPLEEVLVSHQIRNIERLRYAISNYSECEKNGPPQSLEDLLPRVDDKNSSAESSSELLKRDMPLGGFRMLEFDPCNRVNAIKILPKDVYTGRSYEYTKVGDGYELKYEIRNKPMPNRDNWYEYYYDVIEGINTADAKTLSREGEVMPDSDRDGLTDQMETDIYNTNPNDRDTDKDTYFDGEEVKNGYNPLGPGGLDGRQTNTQPIDNSQEQDSDNVLTPLVEARAKARDAKRISDVKQMSTILDVEEAGQPSQALTDCTGTSNATMFCTGPGDVNYFLNFFDPSQTVTTCNANSQDVCQYSISRSDGSSNPTTDNYQICFWLERDSTTLKAGLNRITFGGIIEAGCK